MKCILALLVSSQISVAAPAETFWGPHVASCETQIKGEVNKSVEVFVKLDAKHDSIELATDGFIYENVEGKMKWILQTTIAFSPDKKKMTVMMFSMYGKPSATFVIENEKETVTDVIDSSGKVWYPMTCKADW